MTKATKIEFIWAYCSREGASWLGRHGNRKLRGYIFNLTEDAEKEREVG